MIRVICADISGLGEADYRNLYEKASPERKNKADMYRSPEDALRCVTADALLRYALGMDQYTVEHTAQGKPYISEKPDFHYNLSHSGNWVVIAYGSSQVGVDIERIRPNRNIESIIGRFFSPEEQQYARETKALSSRRFFEVWTAKESYVKYLGTGLRKDLTSFDVFNLETMVCLQHRWLDEFSCLCLCSEDNDFLIEQIDVQQLL